MRVTELAQILRNAGITVIETPGWTTRSLNRAGLSNRIRAVMYHDTQTADAAFAGGANMPTLNYVLNGLGYPLYNVLFGRDGTAAIIAAGSAAHAGNGNGGGMTPNNANREALSLSFDANKSRYPVTAAQLESGARAGKALSDHFGGIPHMMHGEWNPRDRSDPTRIPGGWAALKSAARRGYWNTPASATTTASSSTIKERIMSWNERLTSLVSGNQVPAGDILTHAHRAADLAAERVKALGSRVWTYGVRSLISGDTISTGTALRYAHLRAHQSLAAANQANAKLDALAETLDDVLGGQGKILAAVKAVPDQISVETAEDIAKRLQITVKDIEPEPETQED